MGNPIVPTGRWSRRRPPLLSGRVASAAVRRRVERPMGRAPQGVAIDRHAGVRRRRAARPSGRRPWTRPGGVAGAERGAWRTSPTGTGPGESRRSSAPDPRAPMSNEVTTNGGAWSGMTAPVGEPSTTDSSWSTNCRCAHRSGTSTAMINVGTLRSYMADDVVRVITVTEATARGRPGSSPVAQHPARRSNTAVGGRLRLPLGAWISAHHSRHPPGRSVPCGTRRRCR